ncbi:MAG: DUF1835 domain-containing protein [Gemmatimonadaceae bacterium]
MTQRLNITNGDSAVSTLNEAGIPGKVIAWRDVLHEGPVDSSLTLEALSKRRARFISTMGWGDFAHVSGSFAERDRMIEHLDYFDEVVLWFEDDLYDQLQLIQLLDFFARGAARKKKLSLIQVDGYIPPLSAAKLKELDDARRPVTAEQFALAQRVWKIFGSSDPTAIVELLGQNTSALPYLGAGLKRHLEEFPSSENGLSRSEREALTVIAEGHATPVSSFLEVAKKQESIFLGDIIFYSYLERLSGKRNALLTWADGTPVVAPTADNSREFVKRELMVTPLGKEVLAGSKDWQDINTEPRWLGGVEIEPGGKSWRWNSAERELVPVAARKQQSSHKRSPAKKSSAKKSSAKKSSKNKSSAKKSSTKRSSTKGSARKRSSAQRAPRKKK